MPRLPRDVAIAAIGATLHFTSISAAAIPILFKDASPVVAAQVKSIEHDTTVVLLLYLALRATPHALRATLALFEAVGRAFDALCRVSRNFIVAALKALLIQLED